MLDLIGAKVQVPATDGGEAKIVAPVFPDTVAEMIVYMPILMDNVAVNAQPTIPGRININQAPRAILEGIPGMDETIVARSSTSARSRARATRRRRPDNTKPGSSHPAS